MSRLSLQLPESLHQRLSAQAHSEGLPLEQYLLYLLALRSAPAFSVVAIDPETVEAERAKFTHLLEDLGPAQPTRQSPTMGHGAARPDPRRRGWREG